MEAYLVAIAIIGAIYVLLTLGLTLQYGLTGLVNFGHVGFFAIGAYASAIVSMLRPVLPRFDRMVVATASLTYLPNVSRK